MSSLPASAPHRETEPAAMGAAGRPVHRRMRRSVSDRWVGGVCAGIAEHVGARPGYVRAAAVVLASVGVGFVGYLMLWVLTPQELAADEEPTLADRPRRAAAEHAPGASLLGHQPAVVRRGAWWLAMVLGVIAVAFTVGSHVKDFDLRLGVVLPLLAVGGGAVLTWSQLDDAERLQWTAGRGGPRWASIGRLVAGVALTAVGIAGLASRGESLAGVWDAVVAAFAILVGIGVVAAPWIVRMWLGLQRAQADKVRALEKADIAAHLHDSVLQTLALIQRQSDNPQEVSRLARGQERELRAWLYGGTGQREQTLASALRAVAEEVEDLHGIPIDVVVTGDRALGPSEQAMVQATREAMLNAVRHGRPPISAFLEATTQAAEVFVRDRGDGFDLDQVGPDRLGVRQSILGRMARHGGAAQVRRLEQGTEIALSLPAHMSAAGSRGEP